MRRTLTNAELTVMKGRNCDFEFDHTGTRISVWYCDRATLVKTEDGGGVQRFALPGMATREEILAKY